MAKYEEKYDIETKMVLSNKAGQTYLKKFWFFTSAMQKFP